MRLSIVFVIGALGIIQGLHLSDTLDVKAHRDPCVAKILSCELIKQHFYPYKEKYRGMFTKIEDLKKACKDQAAYIQCIERTKKFCENTILLPLAEEMLKSRRFLVHICRPHSPWQHLYLREASCLNAYLKEAFVHCINRIIKTEDLNPDNLSKFACKHEAAILECSATELQEKCGFYAGYIMKKIYKFHRIFDHKCTEFKADDVEVDSLSSTPYYDSKEAIFHSSIQISHNEPTEGADSMTNTEFEETKLDPLENKVSDWSSEEATSVFDFYHPVSDEPLLTTKDPFSGSFDFDAESDLTIQPDKFDFPELPKYHYMHKNRTTFALYEDLKMGHMKYIGCGEADIFWAILSPLRSKYCTLMDLKSEYSESIFKCTVRIDAPCSPELDEDRNKNAEIFHRRYVVTVLTPPNNQRSEDMAIMNVHYLKVYPSSSMYVPEKKANLWTHQENKAAIKQTEPVNRKGAFESEDYHNIHYQHGSGQKRGTDTIKHTHYLDGNEYDGEYENWDYYPLEEDDDIYFPEILANDVIYIEIDNGDIIPLHDHRSPIHSKSLYQPHSLFRPRIGVMPESTDSQMFCDDGTNRKKKKVQNSNSKERISEFKDETSYSKVKPDQQEYCSAEAICPPTSETNSKFEIKQSMNIDLRNIKTFDLFKEMNQKFRQQIQSSTKSHNGIDAETYLDPRAAYVVTPSVEIELPKSTESIRTEERYKNEFFEDQNSRYLFQEENCHNIMDIADDSSHLDLDYSSSVTSVPDSADSKIDYLEQFIEYSNYEVTQAPYKYLSKSPDDNKVNPKSTIDSENLAESSSENNSTWETALLKIFGKISKIILKSTEKTLERELLHKVLIPILEKIERYL